MRFIFTLLALFFGSSAFADTINRGHVQFTSLSTPGVYSTLYTAGANGSRCVSLTTTNSDNNVQHQLSVQTFNGGVGYGGNAILTVGNAGYGTGSPPQSMAWSSMPLDAYGNGYIQLVFGDTLQATFTTAITAGAVINVAVSCVDFAP